jgi:hypothetical protein
MLGACGGDEEEAAATSDTTGPTSSGTPDTTVPSGTNRVPDVHGAPAANVLQGTVYTFTPTASDPDGDLLTFDIINAPSWATFDPATGRLSGTPTMEHLGATRGIVISVSDGELSAALAEFTLTVHAVATGSATLSWAPPTTNTDVSPLTNLAGYKVYWGPAADTYPNSVTLTNPGLTTYVVTDLVPGTYFFAATALNSSGAESAPSNPARQTIL